MWMFSSPFLRFSYQMVIIHFIVGKAFWVCQTAQPSGCFDSQVLTNQAGRGGSRCDSLGDGWNMKADFHIFFVLFFRWI
jgi:hypothetical protein